jgi:hypothetical protein
VGTAHDKGIQYHADRPGIHLKAMSIRDIEEDLGRDIIRGTAYCLLALSRALDQGSKPKIADLDVHAAVQE